MALKDAPIGLANDAPTDSKKDALGGAPPEPDTFYIDNFEFKQDDFLTRVQPENPP